MQIKTIGFIGLGLIGGSIAKAIKQYHPDIRILAYMRSRDTLEQAVREAKGYLSGALGAMLDLGRGSGPMNHAFAISGEYAEPF